jgi:universal stress protein A
MHTLNQETLSARWRDSKRAAPAPTAHAVPGLKLKKLLVPTDFSAPAAKALHYAIALAGQFEVSIVLMHAVWLGRYQPGVPDYPDIVSSTSGMQRYYTVAAEQARARLDVMRAELEAQGIKAEEWIGNGAPYEEIIEAAKKSAADLIVIATHGHTGLQHLLLGSTVERVVQYAPCSVFVVPEKSATSSPDPACPPA